MVKMGNGMLELNPLRASGDIPLASRKKETSMTMAILINTIFFVLSFMFSHLPIESFQEAIHIHQRFSHRQNNHIRKQK